MKTLYVSDLDGTLLRSDETISEYTIDVLNRVIDSKVPFAFATARSLITTRKVISGIDKRILLIVYNGAFIIDNQSGKILRGNYFDDSVYEVIDTLISHEVYPIVYAYIDENEKFSFVPQLCTEGMNKFLQSRKGDVRTNPVKSLQDLKKGNIFYITCIGEPEKLRPFYEKYKDVYHCVYDTDIYTNEQWFEIMPAAASKSNGVNQLKELLKCDRVVVFGDGLNDIDMFEHADEAYAVSNAREELKKYATQIIDSNNDDGVARWISTGSII